MYFSINDFELNILLAVMTTENNLGFFLMQHIFQSINKFTFSPSLMMRSVTQKFPQIRVG